MLSELVLGICLMLLREKPQSVVSHQHCFCYLLKLKASCPLKASVALGHSCMFCFVACGVIPAVCCTLAMKPIDVLPGGAGKKLMLPHFQLLFLRVKWLCAAQSPFSNWHWWGLCGKGVLIDYNIWLAIMIFSEAWIMTVHQFSFRTSSRWWLVSLFLNLCRLCCRLIIYVSFNCKEAFLVRNCHLCNWICVWRLVVLWEWCQTHMGQSDTNSGDHCIP